MKTKSPKIPPELWNNNIVEMGTHVVTMTNDDCVEDGTIPLTERQQHFVLQNACHCIKAGMLALLDHGGAIHREAIEKAGVKK